MRVLRMYGFDENRSAGTRVSTAGLDEIQAAIFRVKLAHLTTISRSRRDLAELYHPGLADTNLLLPSLDPDIRTPTISSYCALANDARR